jgi:hypothetical protein
VLTHDQLDGAFRVYFEEMHRCKLSKCYWALLHLAIVLPDICAALESSNGKTSGRKYKAWCSRYLADQILNSEEWHEIRCAVLHQGKTVVDKGRYKRFSFSQANSKGEVAHRKAMPDGGLNLDVGNMAHEVWGAMQGWFNELTGTENSPLARNVEANLSTLVQVPSRGEELMPGSVIRGTLVNKLTTSSP